MIREITASDFHQFWPSFLAIIQARETYAFDPQMNESQAYALWCEQPLRTFVCEEDGIVLGSYYLKANAKGPGDHVCNCGYMVTPEARGRGVAKAMCEHSQQMAITLGFRAMQFNSVVSTNEAAVALWQKLGYQIVGTIPGAYRHRTLGDVDTFVMYKQLQP
ncbi:GNAT family N-acetyltransferase [Photobacterium galatheae]|uniref:Acetyltransferase n=1 Tax=Photobacterium galatheae TaxID=1654360 RepID=A0A066S191_9GAMM|nr:GNAT family N-acetyltransferase [Photobacterium galatheae]KDM93423.1 acetyltransferase [Photobacterium galatheae]MCM0147003.1 GNAT family N-acetyltransferase [Photobacterium galatheae]